MPNQSFIFRSGSLFMCVFAVFAHTASADMILSSYTDSASFESAVNGGGNAVDVIDFGGPISGSNDGHTVLSPPYSPAAAVSAITGGGDMFLLDSGFMDPGATVLGLGFPGPFQSAGSTYFATNSYFEISLSEPHEAIGFDVGTLLVGGATLEIEFVGIDDSVPLDGDDFGFYGAIFDTPVDTIVFNYDDPGEGMNMIGFDNLSFDGDEAVVPAPGAAFLAIIGFGAISTVKRRFA